MTQPHVTLFIQCLIDGLFPEVGEALVAVFRRLGISMSYPKTQTCCGQPAFNAGYRTETCMAARRFIEIFESSECVVCPSGSCVHMVRHHYPLLFENEPGWRRRAKAVAAKTYEFTEFLIDVLDVDDVGARFNGRVTYHDSCHLLRGLGIREQPRRLIGKVRQADFVEMNDSDTCCGFGGAFSIKYPDISTAVLDDKVRNILASGADLVVGCDMGCLMNIQGRLHRKDLPIKVAHMAQLLAGEIV